MKKNVNVMMELEIKKALDKDAKKNHRSVGKHINFIIDNYLTNNCNACEKSYEIYGEPCKVCGDKGVA